MTTPIYTAVIPFAVQHPRNYVGHISWPNGCWVPRRGTITPEHSAFCAHAYLRRATHAELAGCFIPPGSSGVLASMTVQSSGSRRCTRSSFPHGPGGLKAETDVLVAQGLVSQLFAVEVQLTVTKARVPAVCLKQSRASMHCHDG